MWHHPKYYKELRKRNRDLSELQQVKLERSVPQSDQAISPEAATAAVGVRPGPGLKHQASSAKQQASSESKPEPVQVQEASSAKRQASQSE